MRLRKDSKTPAAVELFIKSAQRHLGYAADLGGRNMFGKRVGYDAQPWSGAFVDVCLRDAGIKNVPSFTYTPAALAEFLRSGNFSREARPGAIAIYNFSSNVGHAADAFGMPHCGIVTDVREFVESGRFIAIEGNTTGSTSHQQKDGVYQKVRTINEVLVFCHPLRAARRTFNERLIQLLDRGRTRYESSDIVELEQTARDPQLLTINKEIRPGDRNKKIEVIQLALATVTDIRGAEPGKWDTVTAAACARYQSVIGYVGRDVTGLPDVNMLRRLARDTRMFKLDD